MKKTKPIPHIKANDTMKEFYIEKILYGGHGLSHLGSMACFIAGVIADEIVHAQITDVKKQFLIASCCEIIKPSPHRIEPRCPFVAECGGCNFQHIAYGHQLHLKADIVKDCLTRIGGIGSPAVELPLPSPAVFQYRTRANLKISTTPAIRIGFYRRRSHEIIPVTGCQLLVPPLNQALAYCWQVISEQPRDFAKATDLCLIYSGSSQQVLISAQKGTKITAQTIFDVKTGLASGAWSSPAPTVFLSEVIKGITFMRTPFTFYQINGEQNVTLIKLVLDLLSPSFNKPILDLYCGCGNFSLHCAQQGSSIVGIDANCHAIAEARYNAQYNGLQHCAFFCDDVLQSLGRFSARQFDSILLNPSRNGCGNAVIDEIARMEPQFLVYVSCNPATLARDLKRLIHRGYHITIIQPVDMFPQTYHIETVVKLVKS